MESGRSSSARRVAQLTVAAERRENARRAQERAWRVGREDGSFFSASSVTAPRTVCAALGRFRAHRCSLSRIHSFSFSLSACSLSLVRGTAFKEAVRFREPLPRRKHCKDCAARLPRSFQCPVETEGLNGRRQEDKDAQEEKGISEMRNAGFRWESAAMDKKKRSRAKVRTARTSRLREHLRDSPRSPLPEEKTEITRRVLALGRLTPL